jgi:hypothetical protein
MKIHAEIQLLLYDYICGEVSTEERRKIEEHLTGCGICTRELEELKSFAELSLVKKKNPSEELPQEYWREFAAGIEQEISTQRKRHVYSGQKWLEIVINYVRFQPRFAAIIAGSLAVFAVAVSLILIVPKENPNPNINGLESVITEPVNVDERVGQYLKKSKVLLVGISNMDSGASMAEDLSAEKTVSRQLLNEAHYLQQQSIDVQAARLIRDLAKIQENLADISTTNENTGINAIRRDISHNNLLFKVRMAESVYGNARFVSTGGERGAKNK